MDNFFFNTWRSLDPDYDKLIPFVTSTAVFGIFSLTVFFFRAEIPVSRVREQEKSLLKKWNVTKVGSFFCRRLPSFLRLLALFKAARMPESSRKRVFAARAVAFVIFLFSYMMYLVIYWWSLKTGGFFLMSEFFQQFYYFCVLLSLIGHLITNLVLLRCIGKQGVLLDLFVCLFFFFDIVGQWYIIVIALD